MFLPNKRPDEMKRIKTLELAEKFIKEQVELVQKQVGEDCNTYKEGAENALKEENQKR